jgi:hypothetical protein
MVRVVSMETRPLVLPRIPCLQKDYIFSPFLIQTQSYHNMSSGYAIDFLAKPNARALT